MSAWLSRQFQPSLPGMEAEPRPRMTRQVNNVWSPEHNALQSETVKRVTGVNQRRAGAPQPSGMRGSIPDRLALSHRLDKQAQGKARWGSLQRRMSDEGGGDEYDEEAETHPRTGLPEYGNMHTYDPSAGRRRTVQEERAYGHEPHLGFEQGDVPHALSFHGSAASARRAIGKTEEIPVPGLQTVQQSVSLSRVHEALDNPTTTASPRFPKEHKELPHAYEDAGRYTMIDGNHRASAHMIGGQMFMQAKVLRDSDVPAVSAHTSRINKAKQFAGLNPRVQVDKVEGRLGRNAYGDDDYLADDSSPGLSTMRQGNAEARVQRKLEGRRGRQ